MSDLTELAHASMPFAAAIGLRDVSGDGAGVTAVADWAEDRCTIGYDPALECQCNTECPQHGNCCSDFNDFCDGGSTGGSNE